MSDWIGQYSAALDVRDIREQAHKPYIDAYTRLADRTAASSAAALPSSSNTSEDNPASTPPSTKRTATPTSKASQESTELLNTLRADLATTQKARATLSSQVSELADQLAALKTSNKQSSAQISQLTAQKALVERKLRDREEEIRGKARLVETAQDEMVALQLQLNMAEQRSEKLEQENKELVARWKKRMDEEVDKVNRASGWT